MEIKRLRKDQELFNKVDGQMYRVTEVNGTRAEKTGIATVIAGDGELGNSTVPLNESNSLCFRLVNDPNPADVPTGYTVKDGILYYEDTAATEQGQIYVSAIIGAIHGNLVLSVKCRDNAENKVDVFTYNPERDRFNKVLSAIPSPQVVAVTEESILVYHSDTEMVEEKENDEVVIRERFMGTQVILITPKYCCTRDIDEKLDGFTDMVLNEEGKCTYLGKLTTNTDSDGFVEPSKERYLEISVQDGSLCIGETHHIEDPVSITRCKLLDKELLLMSENKLLYGDICVESDKVKELLDTPYLIDITKDGYTTRIALADEQYNIKTLVVTTTRDRGKIITI